MTFIYLVIFLTLLFILFTYIDIAVMSSRKQFLTQFNALKTKAYNPSSPREELTKVVADLEGLLKKHKIRARVYGVKSLLMYVGGRLNGCE